MENIQAWALALLVYPGLLFAVLLALLTEWLYPPIRQLIARTPRAQSRQRPIIYPLSNFLKLAGRRGSAGWPGSAEMPVPGKSVIESVLGVACALAPLMVLITLPLPLSPLLAVGQSGDLFLVMVLISIQPLAGALLDVRAGGTAALRGAQHMGRLLTGLLPALLSVAALVEVTGAGSIRIAALSAAPETGAQLLVRFLSGGVLLLALPWWRHSADGTANRGGAGAYAGQFLQRVALAAFWSLLILPAPGDPVWGLVLYTLGTLAAAIAMRFISERLLPARRERDRANFVWTTAVPVAVVALLVSV